MLPAVGYRQWVLSFTGPMAVRLGYDQGLLAKVAAALARAVMHDMRWAVKERHGLGSVEPLHAGVFMVVQRFRACSCTCMPSLRTARSRRTAVRCASYPRQCRRRSA